MKEYKVIDVLCDEVLFIGTHEECTEFYEAIAVKYGYEVVPNESELNELINDVNSKKL